MVYVRRGGQAESQAIKSIGSKRQRRYRNPTARQRDDRSNHDRSQYPTTPKIIEIPRQFNHNYKLK